jgi:hypothetical protein
MVSPSPIDCLWSPPVLILWAERQFRFISRSFVASGSFVAKPVVGMEHEITYPPNGIPTMQPYLDEFESLCLNNPVVYKAMTVGREVGFTREESLILAVVHLARINAAQVKELLDEMCRKPMVITREQLPQPRIIGDLKDQVVGSIEPTAGSE